MDAKQAPTPTPWRTAIRRGYVTIMAGPETDTTCIADLSSAPTYAERVANAERIVLAVNAHDDLLAALRTLLADMEAEYRDRNGDADHDGMDKARAAIAKATITTK